MRYFLKYRKFRKRIFQKRLLLVLIIGCVFNLFLAEATGEDKKPGQIEFTFSKKKHATKKKAAQFSGSRLETKYTVVQYRSSKALNKFNRKIDYSPGGINLGGLFSSANPQDLPGKVKHKIDALYERVQDILDMRKRSEKKLIIDLYNNKKDLDKKYKELYGGSLRVRAWYVFEMNTIFIHSNDVHEGMLAHEMAHSIIDHFLTVRPPRASAEILAAYVDTHLFRRTKTYSKIHQ